MAMMPMRGAMPSPEILSLMQQGMAASRANQTLMPPPAPSAPMPMAQPMAGAAPAAPAAGMLGQPMGAAAQPKGLLAGLENGLGSNSMALLMAGLGTLSGRDRASQFAGMMQGLQAGAASDKARRDDDAKKSKEAKAKEIAASLWPDNPQMAKIAEAYPEVAISSYVQRAQPKEQWTDVTDPDGTVIGQRNALTKEFKPFSGTGPTETQRNYREVIRQWQTDPANAGKRPPTLDEYQRGLAAARTSNVTVDQRGESEFSKEVGKRDAEMFGGMVSDGVAARADLGRTKQLRTILERSPTGFQGGLQQIASSYGIKLGQNASDIEAANALINQLVPQQRPPGSGTMSDRDVELFKSSLPSLWNTPGGNKLILDTMESLAAYRIEQARIANQVLAGTLTREQGREALQNLPDPLARAREAIEALPQGGSAAGAAGAPGTPARSAVPPIDTSRPGQFRWSPQTGRMEPM